MRANASAPMILEDCKIGPSFQLTDDGAGFIDFPDLMVLWVISGTAWVICMFVVKAYYERRP